MSGALPRAPLTLPSHGDGSLPLPGRARVLQNPGNTRISVVLGSIARDKATLGDLLSVMG